MLLTLITIKSQEEKAGEPDNKASHFFLAQYWAEALAEGETLSWLLNLLQLQKH